MSAVHIRNVSKAYPIYARPADRLKELLTANRRSYHRDFWALQDISLEVPKGQTFGLVGENGSGKSTLLQLIAGILQPTRGSIEVTGRVSTLLELGSGFNPEFTGRENVFLNGAILGLSNAEMERLYPTIESFAEIGEFIEQPVKTYSSGMMVRLAFAVAITVDPDILLVDEALAVGDIYFRQRCMRKIHELARRGVEVRREPRPVMIHALTLESVELPFFTVRVVCGKGTYVRTLCADIGAAIGCGAALARLVRTRVGPYWLDAAVPWAELAQARDGAALWRRLLPSDSCLAHLAAIQLSEAAVAAVLNGRSVPAPASAPSTGGLVRLYAPGGVFLGLGRLNPAPGTLKPERILHGDHPRSRVLPA